MKRSILKSHFSKMKLVAVLSLVMFTAVSCGGSGQQQAGSNQDVTLTIWKPFVDSQEMRNLIADYQDKHPFVKIDYVKKNIENYESDLLNSLAAGTGPDIFSINNAWLPNYEDKIEPAPDKVFTYNDYKNTFVDAVTNDFTQDNKVYGTAISIDTLALYYNKDLVGSAGFASPPKTWDELARQVRSITRQDSRGYFNVSGVAAGTTQNVNRAQDILYLMMLQQGVQPISNDRSRYTFAQPISKSGKQIYPAQIGLTFYTSFANSASANYTWNSQSDYSVDAFANGRAAFLYGYFYTRDTLRQKAPNLNYDVAPVPQPSLDQARVNFANYFGEVVSKQSKNAAVAWDFLKFVTSKENLEKHYKEYKLPSSRKDLVENQTQDTEIGVFAYSGLTAKSFYRVDAQKMDVVMLNAIDNVNLKGMRVDEAISQAESQARTLLR